MGNKVVLDKKLHNDRNSGEPNYHNSLNPGGNNSSESIIFSMMKLLSKLDERSEFHTQQIDTLTKRVDSLYKDWSNRPTWATSIIITVLVGIVSALAVFAFN